MRNVFFAIAFLTFLLPIGTHAATLLGRVAHVGEGDIITILDAANRKHKIRLYGIDCPEMGQSYGGQAREAMTRLAAGKTASVKVMDVDRYGRTVGIVTVDGLNLNEWMIVQGLAWVYPKYCREDFCQDWQMKEQSASRAKVGLWRGKDPTPPWEYGHRRGRR